MSTETENGPLLSPVRLNMGHMTYSSSNSRAKRIRNGYSCQQYCQELYIQLQLPPTWASFSLMRWNFILPQSDFPFSLALSGKLCSLVTPKGEVNFQCHPVYPHHQVPPYLPEKQFLQFPMRQPDHLSLPRTALAAQTREPFCPPSSCLFFYHLPRCCASASPGISGNPGHLLPSSSPQPSSAATKAIRGGVHLLGISWVTADKTLLCQLQEDGKQQSAPRQHSSVC